ncbi:MAG: methylated-DNA--[protein]-cysteine S-methyltransferase [Burkholderiales bacterium]
MSTGAVPRLRHKRRDATPFFFEAYSGYQAKLAAGFATLGVRTDGEFLTGIEYLPASAGALDPQNRLAEEVVAQLKAYLDDPRFSFDLPIRLSGTPFQREVWAAIQSIASGGTLTYFELAKQVYSSPRAVGQACGANSLPIVIPCHRVVAKQGLGGFMNSRGDDALAIKRWLLTHESGR